MTVNNPTIFVIFHYEQAIDIPVDEDDNKDDTFFKCNNFCDSCDVLLGSFTREFYLRELH